MSLEQLLEWYETHKRDLPFRKSRDAWAILVSEIMLQQTRVEAVLHSYLRFMERYPSPREFALATEEEILEIWQGLGYYRRVRMLHQAAQKLASRPLPQKAEEWQKLPGVGDYTAAAVASIAQNEAVVVLDGNVERVASRYFGLNHRARSRRERQVYKDALNQDLLDFKHPDLSNQALMELGALVCLPKNPRCADCPLQPRCYASLYDLQEHFPPKKAPVEFEEIQLYVLLRVREGQLETVGTGFRGYQPGFLHLPYLEHSRELRKEEILEGFGISDFQILGSFRHSITRYRIQVQVITEKGADFSGIGEFFGVFSTIMKKALKIARIGL